MLKQNLRAVYMVRVLALIFVLVGTWMLVCNLIESLAEFNPAYCYYYFETQLLRPLVAILLGLALYRWSRKVGRILLRGLDEEA